ncbi:MAG: hypothetical protein GXX96_20015, partial [Planctomycetaceae bacterium]|nr:hypothetical protein [Planctomycetaceae bacterium]
MSDHDERNNVGETNIERLVSEAYRPEEPDPAFVRRVTQAIAAEAAQRRSQAAGRRARPAARALGWAIAAAILLALGAALGHLLSTTLQDDREAPRRLAGNGSPAQSSHAISSRPMTSTSDWAVESALTAHPRLPGEQVPRLAVGDSLQTGPSERRRVELPDGSALYLNRNTALTLETPKRISLDQGEIYLEVAHPEGEAASVSPSPATGDQNARFVVVTPDRELISLGTKFDVRAGSDGTSVAVTQGKVRVSGLDEPLEAGQQLPAEEDATAVPIGQTFHLIDWTRDLVTAYQSPIVPASNYSGGALVAKRPDGQEASLSMRRYKVDVYIEDGFARTTIDQTYFNHESRRMEGTFFFPLPPDASLSRLAMYVNGKLMEGGMAEREHARRTFESIVSKQKDPALLEWIDGSTFRMRVFPLEGRQEKRIILSYTQRLERLGDRVEYRFPGGHNMAEVGEWSCHVRVKGSKGCRWEADSYEFEASSKGKDLVLDAAAENVKPDRNVVVRLWDRESGESGDKARPRFVSAEHEGRQYLAVRYPFQPGGGHPSRRDWVFLYEASADRDPVLARVQVDVIRTLLENAGTDDTFTILAASSRIRPFSDEPLPVRPKNVKRAVEFLEKAQLVGALDLEKAFRAAAETAGGVESPCLVHLGSGYPKLGEDDHESLAALLPEETTYVGVAVGNRWNRALMKRLADQSGGYFAQINPNDPVAWKAIELSSRLNAPRLTNVRVVDGSETCQFLNMSDVVCEGEELFSVARLDAGAPRPKFVDVTGIVDGKPFSQRLQVQDVAEEADYLPRTWSKLEIDRLVAEDALAHHDEIVNLSMAMYVMSPFTSLLVLENEEMYEQYHVDRGRKDHWALYPCPETIEVVHEPLQSEPAPREEIREGRPSVEDVLKTIVVRGGWGTPSTVWQVSRPGYPRNRGLHRWGYSAEVERPFQVFGRMVSGYRDGPVGKININTMGLESLAMSGTSGGGPMLSDLPYVNRLFGYSAIGRETQSLMMMVTPRIIIQEEEEERLGISWDESGRGWSDGNSRSGIGLDFDWDDDVTVGMPYPVTFSADSSIRVWTSPEDAFTIDQGLPLYGSQGIEMVDFDSLIDLITTTVQPESWDTPWDLYQVEDAVFFAQTGSEMLLNTKVYPVADLVLPFQIENYDVADYQNMLLSRDMDSNGLLHVDDWISIGDMLRVQRQIGVVDKLYQVEKAHFPFPDEPPIVYPPAEVWEQLAQRRHDRYRSLDLAYPNTGEGRIRAALDEPTTADFTNEPLSHVVDFWKDHHDIDIRIATGYLIEAGMSPDPKVTRNLSGIPLREALQSVLSDLNLSYVITDGVILILPEKDAGRFQVRTRHTLYGPPEVVDLLTYAPGMQTTMVDVLAVLDAEAAIDGKPESGRIDPRARRLIERSRRAGWRRLAAERNEGLLVDVVFDGQGRFRVDSETALGLKESVSCDGEHLWHQYPEIGLGAQRVGSRFYGNVARQLIPWLLPSAEELARGADVVAVDDRTVAVVPQTHTNPTRERGQQTHSQAAPDLQVEQTELRLIFAADGRLAERQIVRSGSGEILLRETYDADGMVRLLDSDGKERLKRVVVTEPCEAPDLTPDPSLVVLPMPWRTREHVFSARGLEDDGAHEDWDREDALAVLAAETACRRDSLLSTIGWCFLAKGDRRPGFYTLLLAAGVDWKPEHSDPYGVGQLFVPLESNAEDLIAHYAAAIGAGKDEVGPLGSAEDGFVRRLARLHDLWAEWQQAAAKEPSPQDRTKLEGETAELVKQDQTMAFAASAMAAVAQYGGSEAVARVGDAVETTLRDGGPRAFRLRFLHAEAVARSEQVARGQKLFRALVGDMLDARTIPRIDPQTRKIFFASTEDREAWKGIVQRITEAALEHTAGTQSLAVAASLHDLGETESAERFFAAVTASLSRETQGLETLAAVSYLWRTQQRSRAEAMLDALLANDRYEKSPLLWRLAGRMAEAQGRPARAAECLDRALALQFEHRPKEVDLGVFRTDYGELLGLFCKAAEETPGSDAALPDRLISRIVSSADRWRSVDPQSGEVCRLAGAALARCGAIDLAWDYVTSPLATDEQTSLNWSALGATYHRQGQYELADRAYELACADDPANAELLWNRARVLIEANRRNEARGLLETLAAGSWKPEYGWIQTLAKKALASERQRTTDSPARASPATQGDGRRRFFLVGESLTGSGESDQAGGVRFG